MLQGGDELGRTQSGNNNAYCQDNVLTWLDWHASDTELTDFTAGLIAIRKRFPQLRRKHWLTGEISAQGTRDITWWHPDGREMTVDDWHSPQRGALGLLLAPLDERAVPALETASRRLLVLINRDPAMRAFQLPAGKWTRICDSSARAPFASTPIDTDSLVAAYSVQVFEQDL